jgi:hypothetical protein
MAKVNTDALKKHHFWIVAGLVPLFVLLAVLFVWSGAGRAVAAGESELNGLLEGAKGKQPKGMWVLGELDKQKVVVAGKKDKLWEFNWNDQRTLFTWPVDPSGKLSKFLLDPKDPNYATDPKAASVLKFGDPLPNDNFQYSEFTSPNVYRKAYEAEAKALEPTQFVGGAWQNVLKYVPDWTEKQPESWMLWLALEDLWVQRGILEPVRNVTKLASTFEPVDEKGPDGKPAPAGLKRTFLSRLWQLDLEVKQDGPRRYLTGKLKNITDRVQLLGVGNVMKLNVYFDDQTVPFEFRIEGEFVEAGKQVTINFVPIYHDLPPELNPTAIARVTQEFDARTVPVKRVDQILMGKTGNRHAAGVLKPAKFIPVPDPSLSAPAPGEGGDGAPGGAPAGGGRGEGIGSADGAPGGGGAGIPGMGTNALGGLEGYFAMSKNRYLDATEQVRRMPVAVVLVVDSMYLQDVLSAYSNSKLRFQVTQIHFKRFRDKLPLPSSSGSPSGSVQGSFGSGEGGIMFGGGFGEGDTGAPGGGPALAPPTGGGPRGMPSPGAFGPGGGIALGPGFGGPPGLGGDPRGEGSSGGFGPGMGSMGFSTGVAESQTAAGLIELTIYGIVSLYDRYSVTPPEGTAPADGTAPAAPAGEPKKDGP